MKFGILAPGKIAESMAQAIQGIRQGDRNEELQPYAAGSRSLDRAKAFADRWGFQKAYGSYEELVRDKEVELVYVASPHSHHYEHARLCLENGKHVLLEKAFTVNARQAEELMRMAKERGLLLAEAIWTRYMPSRTILEQLIDSGIIGEPVSLVANLGYAMRHKERLVKPELAGGALLDVGVYPIHFALMVFHSKVVKVDADAVFSPEGVDWTNSVTLTFEDGKLAVLHSTMLSPTDRLGVVYGEKGYIEVHNINNCEAIRVYDADHRLIAAPPIPEQINGYEYEVLSCMRAIALGQTECEEISHAETLRVMKLLDAIRAQWGMHFPCE